jgi:hypothetical protein
VRKNAATRLDVGQPRRNVEAIALLSWKSGGKRRALHSLRGPPERLRSAYFFFAAALAFLTTFFAAFLTFFTAFFTAFFAATFLVAFFATFFAAFFAGFFAAAFFVAFFAAISHPPYFVVAEHSARFWKRTMRFHGVNI